jgi:hypothetical protein
VEQGRPAGGDGEAVVLNRVRRERVAALRRRWVIEFRFVR